MSVGSQQMTSPDKQWTTNTMIALPGEAGGEYYQRMSVTSQDDQTTWLVVDEWAPLGAEYTAPFPLAWSRKEQALFWTFTPTPSGCVVFSNASDLHKLDLQTGVSTQLLGPVGQWLALSPDEGRVASVGPGGLAVFDLATGVKQTVALPEGQAGQIVWSPDGRALALTVDNDPCGDPANSSTSILLVDTQSMTVTVLIERDPRRFSTQAWSLLGSVMLADHEGTIWQMDPQSGDVWNESNPRSAAAAPAELAEIRFFAPVQPEDAPTLQRLVEEFNQKMPQYRVTLTEPPADIDYLHFDAEQYLISLTRDNDCFIEYDPLYSKSGSDLLLDLAPLAQAEGPGFLADFYPEQLQARQQGTQLLGLPLLMRPHVLSYNADLLASLGLDPPDPDWTFADFLRLAEAVSASSAGSSLYGYVGDDSNLLWLIEGLGGQPFNPLTNPPQANFNTPKMAEALTRMAELRRSGAFILLKPALYADADINAVSKAWLEGRVAFWHSIAGLQQIISIGSEVYGEQPPFQTNIVPLPQLPEGSTQMPVHNLHITVEGFFIAKGSPQAQACWTWYRYLVDSGAFPSMPARRTIAASPAWEATVGAERAEMLRLAVEKNFKEGQPEYNDWIQPLNYWLVQAIQAYLDGADLEKNLAEAQRKADAYLACVGPATTAPTSQEDLWQAVSTCVRQVDPLAGW
jgi:ABC-type glycerol-3-phosphate transport system substrate-binding protein